MNEPLPLPPPDMPPAEPPSRRPLAPWLYAAGFVVLALAIVGLWLRPARLPDTAMKQLAALDSRIAQLERRPEPQAVNLGPLTARVTALEQRPAPAPQQSTGPVDLGPLTQRVAALEQRKPFDPAPLEARIAALEAKQSLENQLIARADALSARVEALDTAQRTTQSELTRRIDGDATRLTALERSTSQIAGLVERANRLARVQAAQLALGRGDALGDVSGAPPALARFATTRPPTEAALRLAFPQAARAALAAARPETEGKPMLTRLWVQAQELVTIREGDRVLLGDPVAGVLERTRAALEAGDLAGAVAMASSLTGPAAEAMAGWLAQARALLDARGALAEWAAHG